MNMEHAQVVGRVGVAMVMLVGGPHDGERRAAVVGSPVVVRIKPPKAKKKEPQGWSFVLGGLAVDDDESEKWKEAPAQTTRRYAVYLPEMKNKKATGIALFTGECEMPHRSEVPDDGR